MAENLSTEKLEKDAMELTTVWYGQNEAAYLMHINDLSVKIDRDLPSNKQLKKRLDLYIKLSEELQKDVGKLQNPQLSLIERQQHRQLQEKINELDKIMEELIIKAQRVNLDQAGSKCENKELFKFICKQGEQYNHAIDELSGLMQGQQSIMLEKISTQLLEEGQQNRKSNAIMTIISNNKNQMSTIYQQMKPKCDEYQEKKNSLIKSITGFFNNQSDTFSEAANNLSSREATLNIIKEQENKLAEIEKKMIERKGNYDSKLMEMIELKNLILLKEKQQEEALSQTHENDTLDNVSANQSNQSYGSSQAPSPNLKFVIQKEKPNKYFRICLGIWLVALLILPFSMFGQRFQ